jgi:hypothetical protein
MKARHNYALAILVLHRYHLDSWLSATRMRPPQSGFVQVGLSELAGLRQAPFRRARRRAAYLGADPPRCRSDSMLVAFSGGQLDFALGHRIPQPGDMPAPVKRFQAGGKKAAPWR